MEVLPPDPYTALGVSKDATSAQIKTAYRKLALKHHPDKAADKAAAADEFHKIQSAYELIGEEEGRRQHDAKVQLAGLKKDFFAEKRANGPASGGDGARTEARAPKFDTGGDMGGNYSGQYTTRSSRYDKPPTPNARPYEEDDYFGQRTTSRKYEGYEASPRKPPTKMPDINEDASRNKTFKQRKANVKEEEAKQREKAKKQKDKDAKQERRSKYAPSVEEDVSDSEDSFRRRAKMRPHYSERRGRQARAADSDDSDAYEDGGDNLNRKYQDHYSSAAEYIKYKNIRSGDGPPPPRQARKSPSPRPSHARSASYQMPSATYKFPSSETRRTSRRNSPRREEVSPSGRAGLRRAEAAEARRSSRSPTKAYNATERRPPPSLATSFSDSANLQVPRRHTDDESTPARPAGVKRSDSSPLEKMVNSSARSKRVDSHPKVESKLKESVTLDDSQPNRENTTSSHDSGYNTSSPSETPSAEKDASPPPKTSRKYYYGDSGYGTMDKEKETVSVEYEEPSTVIREPGRTRQSPPPLERTRDDRREPLSRSASYAVRSDSKDETTPRPEKHSHAASTASAPSPSLPRGHSMPLPHRDSPKTTERTPTTPRVSSTNVKDSGSPLFGEKVGPGVGLGISGGVDNSGYTNSSTRRASEDLLKMAAQAFKDSGTGSGRPKATRRFNSEDVKYSDYYASSSRLRPEESASSRRRGSDDMSAAPSTSLPKQRSGARFMDAARKYNERDSYRADPPEPSKATRSPKPRRQGERVRRSGEVAA